MLCCALSRNKVNTEQLNQSMSSLASEILQELESLKSEKTKIEQKISQLESQLKDINLPKQHASSASAASSNGSSSPYPTNGLEPHMIHRYSRHLVLPSFGVQGTTHSSKLHYQIFKGNFIFIENVRYSWILIRISLGVA